MKDGHRASDREAEIVNTRLSGILVVVVDHLR